VGGIPEMKGLRTTKKTSLAPHFRGVSLTFTLKSIFKAKEELWKYKYFPMQKCNLQKDPLKETKILQDIIIL
jgi:hypothetical protein